MTDIEKDRLENATVAIVDDHEIVLEGFKSFMQKNGIGSVETFSRAKTLLARIPLHPFSVYIVDVELPDMDASALIDGIRALDAKARIVINTIHEEPWVVNKMTKKKVDGVVYKSGHMEQLLEAVIAVMEGRQFFCCEFKKSQQELQEQDGVLTQRQTAILKEIAHGYSTKEISEHLFISANTVESHRRHLFCKLKAHNMAELIVKAIAAGYISPAEISAG